MSRLGEPKCLCEEKLSRLPGLPYELSRPPRQLGVIHINGCLNFTTIEVNVGELPRVTQVEDCLGYPRPYKWGFRSDREPSRVPERTLKCLRRKGRKMREFVYSLFRSPLGYVIM